MKSEIKPTATNGRDSADHRAISPLREILLDLGNIFANSGVSHLARVTQNNPKIGVQNT